MLFKVARALRAGVFAAGLGLAGAVLQAQPALGAQAVSRACGLTSADAAGLRKLVQSLVDRGHAPGAVLDVRCDGQPWLAFSTGLADSARGTPMRGDHLFRIYSMTKPMTSLLVLMLAEEGRLSIDDPVALHLPEFAGQTVHSGSEVFPPETVAAKRPPTVRDLLRHTAGLTYIAPLPSPVHRLYVQRGIDHGGGNKIEPTDGSAQVASLADLSRRLGSVPMLNQPGSRFTYGNATDVLGRLVEVVSGVPLREAFEQRLLDPLGMRDTSFRVPPERLQRLTAAYMAPSQTPANATMLRRGALHTLARSNLTLVDDGPTSVFSRPRAVDFGGAGLVSTADDYQRFLRLMLRGGEIDGRRLLRRDTVAAMTVNQVDADAIAQSNLAPLGLGFGLGVATFAEPERAPGALPRDGYFWGGAASTYFWVDPARRITGVLMTQVFGGDVAPYFVEVLDALYRPRRGGATRP